MKKLEYKILRYIPNQVSGEFANVGLLMYCKNDGYINSYFIPKYRRVSNFFPGISGKLLLKYLKDIENKANSFVNSTNFSFDFNKFNNIESVSDYLLIKNDSSLQFSETFVASADNYDKYFKYLIKNIFEKYEYNYKFSKTDDEAWSSYYKKLFDEFKITNKLNSVLIKTENDEFEFSHAWKNGMWNVYKPISFELHDAESIKNKVYKWIGIMKELKTYNKPLKIAFLSLSPKLEYNKKANQILIKFINDQIESESNEKVKAKVIMEDKAEKYVENIKEEIE